MPDTTDWTQHTDKIEPTGALMSDHPWVVETLRLARLASEEAYASPEALAAYHNARIQGHHNPELVRRDFAADAATRLVLTRPIPAALSATLP